MCDENLCFHKIYLQVLSVMKIWAPLFTDFILTNINVSKWDIINTELAIYALDQVHCWDAYFRPRIGHYENFTPLNFQPLLFPKQWRLVDRRCTLEPLVAK
jgi:hypothetical protein